LFEKVESVIHHHPLYEVQTSKSSYTADYLVIATGFYDIPYLLQVPGEDLSKVKHYYTDPNFLCVSGRACCGSRPIRLLTLRWKPGAKEPVSHSWCAAPKSAAG
jgi:hypothetical protein